MVAESDDPVLIGLPVTSAPTGVGVPHVVLSSLLHHTQSCHALNEMRLTWRDREHGCNRLVRMAEGKGCHYVLVPPHCFADVWTHCLPTRELTETEQDAPMDPDIVEITLADDPDEWDAHAQAYPRETWSRTGCHFQCRREVPLANVLLGTIIHIHHPIYGALSICLANLNTDRPYRLTNPPEGVAYTAVCDRCMITVRFHVIHVLPDPKKSLNLATRCAIADAFHDSLEKEIQDPKKSTRVTVQQDGGNLGVSPRRDGGGKRSGVGGYAV